MHNIYIALEDPSDGRLQLNDIQDEIKAVVLSTSRQGAQMQSINECIDGIFLYIQEGARARVDADVQISLY